INAAHQGGAATLTGTLDGAPLSPSFDGTKQMIHIDGMPNWSASSPTHHTLSLTGECGTVTSSVDFTAPVAPTVPPVAISASTTYVNAGDPVKISLSPKSFAFPNCMNRKASVVGIE